MTCAEPLSTRETVAGETFAVFAMDRIVAFMAKPLCGAIFTIAAERFYYIASAQKNYRLCRYVAEQLQLQGEKRNSVL